MSVATSALPPAEGSLRGSALGSSNAALKGRLDELERVLKLARTSGATKASCAAAHKMAHQVYVAAEREGYREVANAVWHIEDALLAMSSGELEAGSLAWRQIDAAYKAAQAGSEEEPTLPENEAPLSSDRILLLCNRPEFCEVVTATARKKRISVTVATSKREVMALLLEDPFDGIILAWRGDAEGSEALQKLRASDPDARLPTLVVGSDNFETRLAATRAGATLFLTDDQDGEAVIGAYCGLPPADNETRVLLVGEAPWLDETSISTLERSVTLTRLPSASELLPTLERIRPQAVMLSDQTHGASAAELCALVRTTPRWRDLPVVVLRGDANPAERMRAYRAGADDVITPESGANEISLRLRVRLDRSSSHQEQSNRDVLTGLLTRRAFVQAMEARLAEAKRPTRPLSLCLCDLDKFKQINDSHGHSVGDEVLATFGMILNSSFRIEDLRGRWGGEEFITAFAGEWADSAREIFARATSRFAKVNFEGAGGQPFNVTVSAGIATYPLDGGNLDDLVLTADERLYAAKLAGRNRIRT